MLYWIFDLDDTLYQIKSNYHVVNNLYVNYSFIKEDKKLKVLLNMLTGKKVIMTNSVNQHCQNVIKKLKIKDCFHHTFDRNTFNGFLKPHPKTYIKLMNDLNMKENDLCVFFDDSPINLIMAKKFGWMTILITPFPWKYQNSHPSIDLIFPTVHNAVAFLVKRVYKL
jgi:FMN phosphatase YigB (HAD superfamily)